MLKRNLFAILMMSLAMVFATEAIGQWNPDIDKIKTSRVKKPTGLCTETTIPLAKSNSPQAKSKKQVKWEMPDFDADINTLKTSKPKTNKTNSYIGETEKNINRKQKKISKNPKASDQSLSIGGTSYEVDK